MRKIKITSGDYAGRFVGPNIGGGLTTNADLLVDPETAISGLPYSLYKKTRRESVCGAKAARMQAALKAIGLDSELV